MNSSASVSCLSLFVGVGVFILSLWFSGCCWLLFLFIFFCVDLYRLSWVSRCAEGVVVVVAFVRVFWHVSCACLRYYHAQFFILCILIFHGC